jgi:hypothetical protein
VLGVAGGQQAGNRRPARQLEQTIDIEVSRALLRRAQLPVADHVVAVECDTPAGRDAPHEAGPGAVLRERPLHSERVAAVLELDADRVSVRVPAREEWRGRVRDAPGVARRVPLVHELDDAPVEAHQVVGAHLALRVGEPVDRGLEAADVRVEHDAGRALPAAPGVVMCGLPPFDRHRAYNVRHQGKDSL